MQTFSKPNFDVPPNTTSYSLLERVKHQDKAAWCCLTELYGPLVYHWCRQAGLCAEDSADILQEVFRSLVIHIGGFEKTKASGSFRAWLYSIARNKIRDHFKIQANQLSATGGSGTHLQLLSIPDRELQNGDSMIATGGLMHGALRIVQGEIKETTWLAFWRSTMDDIAPAAVAGSESFPPRSVVSGSFVPTCRRPRSRWRSVNQSPIGSTSLQSPASCRSIR